MDSFAQREEIIIKHMKKFAAIENKRAQKVWGLDVASRKAMRAGGRPPKEVTPRQRSQAAMRWKAGHTFTSIMKSLDLSKYALSRVLAQEGLRPFPERDVPVKAAEIRTMLHNGMKLGDIAYEMKISRQAVSDCINRYGLDKW